MGSPDAGDCADACRPVRASQQINIPKNVRFFIYIYFGQAVQSACLGTGHGRTSDQSWGVG